MRKHTDECFPRLSATMLALAICLLYFLPAPLSAGDYTNKELVSKSQVCLDCHDDQEESLKGSPHQLTAEAHIGPGLAVGCIGCHSGWEQHIDDPSPENITIPSELQLADIVETCGKCHQTPHQVAMASTDPHGRAGITCTSCHTIHNNRAPHLVKDDTENFCGTCHSSVRAEFEERSAHPLVANNIRCTDCHNIGGVQDPLYAAGHDWKCQTCHPEKSGPFLYEHPVVYSYLVNGSGCVECHQPHGSPNDRLLRQPDDGLCFQCHGIPPKHMVEHDGIATNYACAYCHSDIHGSFDNKVFLDPDIGYKFPVNCIQSGCHILGE